MNAVKIMFVCTGNSARSQMPEGFARHLGQGWVETHIEAQVRDLLRDLISCEQGSQHV